jgi:hypothetical protein
MAALSLPSSATWQREGEEGGEGGEGGKGGEEGEGVEVGDFSRFRVAFPRACVWIRIAARSFPSSAPCSRCFTNFRVALPRACAWIRIAARSRRSSKSCTGLLKKVSRHDIGAPLDSRIGLA